MKVLVFIFIAITNIFCEKIKPSHTIVGGDHAVLSQFPYFVGLCDLSGNFNCGGSIISTRFVLTAAHCVSAHIHFPNEMQVVAGTVARNVRGTKYPVGKIIMHEKYVPDGNGFHDDIALLKMKIKFTFNDLIKPIGIKLDVIPSGSKVTAIGWGSTGNCNSESSSDRHLQYVEMTTLSNSQCASSLSKYVYHPGILCVSHPCGKGVCFGDSGGPAIYNGKIVGVTSFVTSNCGSSSPDGFAKISYYSDWLREQISKELSNKTHIRL